MLGPWTIGYMARGLEKESLFVCQPTWMQYTGLKDEKGTEIYEGDVVSNEAPGGFRGPMVVEWVDDCFGFNLYSGGKYTVIGNIYENPELLDKKL